MILFDNTPKGLGGVARRYDDADAPSALESARAHEGKSHQTGASARPTSGGQGLPLRRLWCGHERGRANIRPARSGTAPTLMRKWLRDGSWWAAVAGGAIAFPIAVLLHELGHFGAYAAFGFPDPVLGFSSASWSGAGEFARLFRAGDVEAAAAIVEPWQEAVGAATGPFVSYLIIIACVLAVRRFGPGPLSLVFAFLWFSQSG